MTTNELAAAAGENRRTFDRTRPITGWFWRRAPPRRHAAALSSNAAKDCGATVASRVDEQLVDADFGDEGDMGGQGVGIIVWKGDSLGLRTPQER